MKMNLLISVAKVLNVVSLYLIAGVALLAVGYTLLSAFGVTPWLQFTATFGDVSVPQAGLYTQIFVAVLMIMLASFLPTGARVSSLELHHRKFHLKMEDVAQAYYHCHAADRSGVFSLSSEFDAVRERLTYLRDHPDLGNLEHDVLEVAAQMSQQAKHLASVYSEENVGRAKLFLRQRQEEAARQQDRIAQALTDSRAIEKWADQVDIEESVVMSQLEQLEDRINQTLPDFGWRPPMTDGNIYPLQPHVAAE